MEQNGQLKVTTEDRIEKTILMCHECGQHMETQNRSAKFGDFINYCPNGHRSVTNQAYPQTRSLDSETTVKYKGDYHVFLSCPRCGDGLLAYDPTLKKPEKDFAEGFIHTCDSCASSFRVRNMYPLMKESFFLSTRTIECIATPERPDSIVFRGNMPLCKICNYGHMQPKMDASMEMYQECSCKECNHKTFNYSTRV